jgi:glycosyltransferase involved in cell wall biosynthesis
MDTRSGANGETSSGRRAAEARVRVLHVITDLTTGGSQIALSRLLARIDRTRFDPFVVCLKNGDAPLAAGIRDMNVPVFDLELTGPSRIGALARAYRVFDEIRPAIVHAWLFHAVLVSRFAARMTGIPIVISARRNINLGSPLRERVNRITAPLDDRVIAVSEAARRTEIARSGVSDDKVVVIPNGVDTAAVPVAHAAARAALRRELRLPPDSTVVATAGRLHPSKGIDDFLRAASIVSPRRSDVRFLVIGDGPERSPLERLAADLRVEARALFLGERGDLASLLAGSDLFVLASREEGMPNVLLEAMAAALPVVATSAGGTAEVIAHRSTGLLVPPGDVEAIAEAMYALLDDAGAAAAMAARARQAVAESFSIDATVRRTEALYEELLREKLTG